jgi:hypothetical protein
MDAASRVFNDLAGQTPNDTRAIAEAFRGYGGDDEPKYDDYFHDIKTGSKAWREAHKVYGDALNKYTMAQVRRFMKNNKNRLVFVFSYADDSGDADLEHGDLFDQVPHVRVSKH